MQLDNDIITATNEGALLWKVEPDPGPSEHGIELRAGTWIGNGTAVDPTLIAAIADAGDGVSFICRTGRAIAAQLKWPLILRTG